MKLLAITELDDGEVSARVHPQWQRRPRSATRTTRSSSRAAKVGQLMFYGPGGATATASVGDLVHVARNLAFGGRAIGIASSLPDDPSDGRRDRPVATSTSTWRIGQVVLADALATEHQQEGFSRGGDARLGHGMSSTAPSTVAELRHVRAVASLWRARRVPPGGSGPHQWRGVVEAGNASPSPTRRR